MTNFRKLLSLLAAGLVCWCPLQAQEEGFDLTSQRSESQDVRKVPGHVVDHGGIIINPMPHSLEVNAAQRLDLSRGVAVKDRRKAFSEDVDFLKANRRGPVVDIDFGAKAAARAGVKPLSGAYALSVGEKGITIVGYDERGAFYGIQTLRQLVASPAAADGTLPAVEVNDYPDLPLRGVVEGFYGTPWSHEVRLSLIDFYGRFKMNCYIYGPKDDP